MGSWTLADRRHPSPGSARHILYLIVVFLYRIVVSTIILAYAYDVLCCSCYSISETGPPRSARGKHVATNIQLTCHNRPQKTCPTIVESLHPRKQNRFLFLFFCFFVNRAFSMACEQFRQFFYLLRIVLVKARSMKARPGEPDTLPRRRAGGCRLRAREALEALAEIALSNSNCIVTRMVTWVSLFPKQLSRKLNFVNAGKPVGACRIRTEMVAALRLEGRVDRRGCAREVVTGYWWGYWIYR